VFEVIEKKNDIKSVSELGRSLVNIVTTDSAALTHIAFQPVFIKIETPSLPLIFFLNLSLQQPMASNFRHFSCARQQISSQFLQDLEPPVDPEVMGIRKLKVIVGHTHSCGGRQILDFAICRCGELCLRFLAHLRFAPVQKVPTSGPAHLRSSFLRLAPALGHDAASDC
jgi:hypothetical protein